MVAVDEARKVVQTAFDLIEIIKELKSGQESKIKTLEMKFGIHTGRLVGGILGNKLIRYDIFGQCPVIADKVLKAGSPMQVCVSEDTKDMLQSNPEMRSELYFETHQSLRLKETGEVFDCFLCQKRTGSMITDSQSSGSLTEESSSEEEIE